MLRHAVSDEHLKHIGDITVSFSLLELIIQLFIGSLISDQQQIGKIITSELSFRNLRSLLISLYLERFGKDNDFDALQNLMKESGKVEDRRNQLIHSTWGASYGESSITRFKNTSKEKQGYKYVIEELSAAELESFTKEIKTLSNNIHKFHEYLIDKGKAYNL